MAQEITEPAWLKTILELAKDLEEEADKIDAEER